MGSTDKTPVFFHMLANTTVDTKCSKSLLIKTTGHEKLKINVMPSDLADERNITPFVIFRKTSYWNCD
jgi:hypothetical protein